MEVGDSRTVFTAMSGIGLTTPKLEQMSFSDPYLDTALAFVVRDHRRDDFDTLEDVAADSLQTLDLLRPVVDRSTFQFVNGTQQAVDMFLLRDGGTIGNTRPALDDVPFSASGPLEVRPGQVEFVVTSADNSEIFATLGATLTESMTYTLAFDTVDVLHLLED